MVSNGNQGVKVLSIGQAIYRLESSIRLAVQANDSARIYDPLIDLVRMTLRTHINRDPMVVDPNQNIAARKMKSTQISPWMIVQPIKNDPHSIVIARSMLMSAS
jgi:hypothetical protein